MMAMETRRLYSDLLQRSEVDLLTNVHNRRSLGERMDALIEEARLNASVFGLIYIDLDRFKPINDRYGHHVGDLFLQEVAHRMKKQLRSHDLLARLGGDEFAVLLPKVSNRTRIEEIALRLEHCFKEPFPVEGNVLQGSASFGYAMYPEDGVTKETLLSAADAAMYAAKNFRKQFAAQKVRSRGNRARGPGSPVRKARHPAAAFINNRRFILLNGPARREGAGVAWRPGAGGRGARRFPAHSISGDRPMRINGLFFPRNCPFVPA